ncbi:related to integral membrane protein [Rhynchosporium secalis]|uniref:Related to integral membrane protein n=1 Tax=Rhynchosporium secalis TaxID=38038 RepID=A0A1E1M1R2_RHYSE|nr:related to integral membrane protein [Rhynchosporium secalis]
MYPKLDTKMIQPWSTVVARQIIISEENQGPIVNIAAWIGMNFMVLCVLTRVISKYTIFLRPTIDDALILATMMFAVLHTIMLSTLVENGLGTPQSTVSDNNMVDIEKFGYTSQLLYIPALGLAKLSTVVYLRALSPAAGFVIVNQIIEAFVVLWAFSTEFAIAFQCTLPTPWEFITSECFNTTTMWNVTGFLDILTDIAIILLPGYLVWRLRMPKSKKVLVVIIFGFRIFILPLTIWRLQVLNTESVDDKTFPLYREYLATTVQLNFAIVAACIPFVKPFMESMNSGAYNASAATMDSSYGAGSKLNSNSGDTSRKANKPKGSIKLESLGDFRTTNPSNSSRSHNTAGTEPTCGGSSDDDFHFGLQEQERDDLGPLRPDKGTSFTHIGRSTPAENQARSSIEIDSMIIRQTTEWDIQETYEQVMPSGERFVSRATTDNASDQGNKEWRRAGQQGHYVI